MVYGFLVHSLRRPGNRGVPGSSIAAPFAPPAGTVSVLDPFFDQQQHEREAAAAAHAAPGGAGSDEAKDSAAERVWIARFYTPEGNDQSSVPRREAVAERVREEFELQGGTVSAAGGGGNSGGGGGGGGAGAGGDGGGGGEADGAADAARSHRQLRGVFPVAPNRLFGEPAVVVWQQFMDCAYVLVLRADAANVPLAANFLCVFISAVVEHFGNYAVFSSPAQFYQRPEDVFVLLDKFLPSGQLSYIRGNLVKTLLDEARAMLQMKSLHKKAKLAIA